MSYKIVGLPVLTIPVAVVLGFIGYQIESSISSRKTPVSETSISEQREKRLLALNPNEPVKVHSVLNQNIAGDLYKKNNY